MNHQLPEGFTVKYEHKRLRVPRRMADDVGWVLSQKGGSTVARVYDRDGRLVAEATATVHPKDNYCKRIGREVALGRALGELEKRSLPPRKPKWFERIKYQWQEERT